jgi:dolichol-phosphate mannosyltransferase
VQPDSSATDIAIVIPVYNEEENVLPLADEIAAAMQRVGRPYELMFVDDASTDSTAEKIARAQAANPCVRGLRHERNAGQSAALWTGIQATRAPIIVTLDGDRQNDPADLPQLLAALEECDFVCGVRARRQDSWIRLISTKVARRARRMALKVDFCDTGCAFRAFRREALQGVFPFNGMHRFLPVLVHSNGFRAKEIDIGHRPRVAGQSKYGMSNRLWRGIYDLIALVWYQKRRIPPLATSPIAAAPSPDNRRITPAVEITGRVPELRPVEAQ